MLLFNRKIIKLITVGIVTNDYFKKLTKRIKSDNRTFEIIRVGCLRYVYYNETRIMKMYVLRSDKNVAGIHLVRMVHQDVINKLKEGEYTIKSTSTVEEAKLYTFFNPKGVENCINNYGSNLIMIDINKCYWNTISIIGAITQIGRAHV